MTLIANRLVKRTILLNRNLYMSSNSTIYNPIIGSNLGVPLNILQLLFTTTYYHENIITNQLIFLQFALGIFTYGTDRLLDASNYLKNNEDLKKYTDKKIDYYDFLIKRMNYNIFIIIVSYIYIFNLLIDNEETYPFLLVLTSTLFYRDIKKNFGEFKALYISILWTLGSVILPCVIHDNNYEILNYPSIYIPSCLLMFGSSNMLDIKDIDEDREDGINTLPIKLGKDKSILLTNTCFVLAVTIFTTNFI